MSAVEFTDLEKRVTLWGVAIVFLLSALDQTIVATAMPRIISELNGLALYSWVTTAYLLSSTVMVPIWGKLGDLYGRKPILLAGILIFLAGSWLSGLSGEFGDLPLIGGGMVQLSSSAPSRGSAGARFSPPPSRSSATSIRRASEARSAACSAPCSASPAPSAP